MKILSLHIDGFGRFYKGAFGPFERPVTVFLGPNEAGKSTLLEFIRRVLFGFRTARGRAPSGYNDYPPLAGGRHGGNLTIVSDKGETVTVQRFQGAGGGPVRLTAASGGPLPEGDLSRLLGQHSREVFKNVFTFTLDELHDEALLKDDSVNVQIYSVGMGATKLPAARNALGSAKQALFLKGGSRHKIAGAGGELGKVDSQLAEVANNASAYSDLTSQLKEVEEELERLSGLRRKHQLELNQQKQLEGAWEDWNDLNDAERELSRLPFIEDFPADGISRLEALEERISTAQGEYKSASELVEGATGKAEAPVEHEAILTHSTEIRELDQGRTSFVNSVRDLPKRITELKDHERSLAATLKDLGAEWDEARLENFDLSMAVREDVSQYRERLQGAEQKLGLSKSTLTQHVNLLEEAAEAEGRAKREIEAAGKPVGRKNGSKVLPAVCVAAGLTLLALGMVLGGSALFLGVAAGLALAGVAAYLFVTGRPSAGADTEFARLARELERAQELAKQRHGRVEKCKKDVEEAELSLESVQRSWRQWLADRGLLEKFQPETVDVLQGKVELGRNQLGSLRSHRERIDAIQYDVDEYVAKAAPLASDFGVPFDRNDSNTVAAAAHRLIELHDEVNGKVNDRTNAETALKNAQHQLKTRASDLRKIEKEMEGLLHAGGTADAEDFRTRAEIVRRRMDLEEKRREAHSRLQRLSGPGEPLDVLKKQLGDTDFQTILDQASLAQEESDNADLEIREFSNRQGSIQKDLKNLTGEEESSRLRAERHRWLEEMRGHAREWAVRTIAENLLKEAQGKFEKERQPDVVRHSEEFFRNITDGRYQAVFSPLDSSEIQVTDSSGVPKQPSQLSRGTREQLFLSLRFGLIQDLGQRSEPLPVILDEALVNFDPERGMRAARAFVELSRTNQLLVFTCHPTIVELFQEAAAQSGVQEPQVVPIG